ncbi:MAG: hypothetical protein WBG43_12375 [Marinifilaceae bacterium]
MGIINDFLFTTWYGGFLIMIIASLVIAKACDVFEASTEYLGRNMEDGVKGATLNAVGSSMPEFLTTVFFLVFAAKENLGRDFAASVGGDTGSAIFNSVVIPMLVIAVVVISGLVGANVSKKVILRDGLFLLGAELLLLVLLSSDRITHWHGWVFTAFYLVYLFYTLKTMNKSEEVENDEDDDVNNDDKSWFEKFQFKSKDGRVLRSWILLCFSTLIIALACAGLVEGCKGISNDFAINPLFIALILVAAASSVPDAIISMRDAKRGNHDDALSNVLGSNIFDITISMGLPLAVYLLFTGQTIDFTIAGKTLIDIRIMLVLVTLVTMCVFYFAKTLQKKHVFILFSLYAIFILYAIGAADYHAKSVSLLSEISGTFIEFLNRPGGVEETLRELANYITGNW